MALLIRITDPDGTNAVTLGQLENITVYDTLNSSDEGVNFDVPKNYDKADIINPYTGGYAKFWEAWDTATNKRVNYGPISAIIDGPSTWRIEGKGRSQLLADIRSSVKTFYARIDKFVDDLRFENIAIEPRTTTLVHSLNDDAVEDDAFGAVSGDIQFQGLSVATKDNTIDDDTGYIKLNEVEPSRSFYTTTSYWAGTGPVDSLIVDLGQKYDISRVKLLFPWWGGLTRAYDRAYEFVLKYATDDTPYLASGVQGRNFSNFTTLYDTIWLAENPANPGPDDGNHIISYPDYPYNFWIGSTNSGIGYGPNNFYVAPVDKVNSASMRYLRVDIGQVRAWYNSSSNPLLPPHDGWDFQCEPAYTAGSDSFFGSKNGTMHNKSFDDRTLKNANDCFASIVEVGAYKEIIPRGEIQPLVLQKIDGNNLQITYSHTPWNDDTKAMKTGGFWKYEPGSLFRNFRITHTGSTGGPYYKFFASDCNLCYPDPFNFGVVDQYNNAVYLTDLENEYDIPLKSSIFTKHIIMKGGTARVTWVDAWPAKTDQLSFGGSYHYSEVADDTAILHFKGRSLKWYATVPAGKVGATVKIEIRHKAVPWLVRDGWYKGGGQKWDPYSWTTWSTLEASFKIPDNIHAEKVWELPYDNVGVLKDGFVYEIKITNLDGKFCSIDSFEGYWSGSFTMYGEDSTRIRLSNEDIFKQLYDKRFQGGSMYKWNKSGSATMVFEGDRVIILSARGRQHGKVKITLFKYDEFYGEYGYDPDNRMYIPGGNADGTLTMNIGTGRKGNETTQYIIFDSNDKFTGGLTWGLYGINIAITDIETYKTTPSEAYTDNFLYRCKYCAGDPVGTHTINKYVYLDAIGVHEAAGLSLSFTNQTHLEQLESVAEALQVEWDVAEEGVILSPRVGVDTNVVLREGANTLINYEVVNDVSQVASILYSNGSDIDGFPLFAITEDKKAREILGRTVMRQEDFRDIGDYMQLIGISRGALRKRRLPEKRITITHIGDLDLNKGDTFLLYTKKLGQIRVRLTRKERVQSTSGTEYNLECTIWPLTD